MGLPRSNSTACWLRSSTPAACATSRSKRDNSSTWTTITRAAERRTDRAESASEDSWVIPATSRLATSNVDTRWLAPIWTVLLSSSSPPPSLQPGRPCGVTAPSCLNRSGRIGRAIRPGAFRPLGQSALNLRATAQLIDRSSLVGTALTDSLLTSEGSQDRNLLRPPVWAGQSHAAASWLLVWELTKSQVKIFLCPRCGRRGSRDSCDGHPRVSGFAGDSTTCSASLSQGAYRS